MSDDQMVRDLFGNIRPMPGRRGRPKHIPDDESIAKVQMGLVLGWSNERIADAVEISPPTLRRCYKRELALRNVTRDQLNLKRLQIVWKQVSEGSVSASRELSRLIEQNDLMLVGHKPKSPSVVKTVKEPKLGKKELANRQAQTAHLDDAGWGELLN